MSYLDLVVTTALKVPGVKVNRTEFLKQQFSKFYSEEQIKKAIETNPSLAGIPKHAIDRIAKSTINNQVNKSSVASFVAGIPGGIAMLGTVPADIAQFFSNAIILCQKLAYLYGWPELDDVNDSEVLKEMVTLFIGVMFGVTQATKVLNEVSRRLAVEVAKRLPKLPLTKFAWYRIIKEIVKWLGVKLTKDQFAKALAKVIPVVGGIISGVLTYTSMQNMAKNLKKELSEGALANVSRFDEASIVEVDDEIEIELNLD